MNVAMRNLWGNILDATCLGYAIHLLAVLIFHPTTGHGHILLASFIVSRAAGALVHARNDVVDAGTRVMPSSLSAVIQVTGTWNVLAVLWHFMQVAGRLPGNVLGIPASLFFLPEFIFSMVMLASLERAVHGTIVALRALATAMRAGDQKMLKCNAEARSILPS